jgi:hypothetical protein
MTVFQVIKPYRYGSWAVWIAKERKKCHTCYGVIFIINGLFSGSLRKEGEKDIG